MAAVYKRAVPYAKDAMSLPVENVEQAVPWTNTVILPTASSSSWRQTASAIASASDRHEKQESRKNAGATHAVARFAAR